MAVPDKEEVPVNASLHYRLDWLAGLLDSDGSAVYTDKFRLSYAYQVTSVSRGFLADVQTLLRGFGVPSVLALSHDAMSKSMPGGEYDCQKCYRLSISSGAVKVLIDMGLTTYRVPCRENNPTRTALRYIKVVSVEPDGVCNKVYCFNEPERHRGVFNGVLTSQCGETPNRSDEPCNLGSLVLSRYFLNGNRSVDWKLLEEDAWNATLFLDNILDRNVFPHPDITRAAFLTRKLGLGVMGWADLLAMCHIHYDSEEAIALGTKVMSLIEEVSHACSEKMAREKGPYEGYDASKTDAPMRRNETTTSIAPTGSIAIIAGVGKSQSIEPHYD